MAPDYYADLQIAPSAEQEVVEAAYRRLAQKYHPDHNPNPDASARMVEINQAYAVLSDPLSRARYDSARHFTEASPHVAEAQPQQAPRQGSTSSPPAPRSPTTPIPRSTAGCSTIWRIGVRLVLVGVLIGCLFVVALAYLLQPRPASNIGGLEATPSVLSLVTPVPRQVLYACVPGVLQHSGPGYDYPALSPLSYGWGVTVYGTTRDWYYLGMDDSGNNLFAPTSTLCNQSVPTLNPPAAPFPTATQVPRIIYQATSPADAPASDSQSFWAGYTRIPEKDMYVCAPTANIRSGPGLNYPIVKTTTDEWHWRVFGKIGEWYYIGYDDQRVDEFMHQSVLCDQPVTPSASKTADTQDIDATARAVQATAAYESQCMIDRISGVRHPVCTPLPKKR